MTLSLLRQVSFSYEAKTLPLYEVSSIGDTFSFDFFSFFGYNWFIHVFITLQTNIIGIKGVMLHVKAGHYRQRQHQRFKS